MSAKWLLSSKSVLLAAIILSGGGGLPVLDVLLYHVQAPTHLAYPHFETSDAPHSHGDVCRLGSIPPYSPQPAPLDLGVTSVAVYLRSDVALSATAPRSIDLDLLPQPRAPPDLPA